MKKLGAFILLFILWVLMSGIFDPLLFFLIRLEKLLLATPWPIILLILGGLAWLGSRSWKLVVGSILAFMAIGYFGMWKDCMATVAIITVCTIMCIAVGIPIGAVSYTHLTLPTKA
mgnify:CR=1 FL=1